jgi:hypothetical protein
VRGQWKGSWEAYGGGGGATSVEFGVRGEDWEWGDYGLDKVPPPGPTFFVDELLLGFQSVFIAAA